MTVNLVKNMTRTDLAKGNIPAGAYVFSVSEELEKEVKVPCPEQGERTVIETYTETSLFRTDENGDGLFKDFDTRWKQILSCQKFHLNQKTDSGRRKAIRKALESGIPDPMQFNPFVPSLRKKYA